MIYTFSWSTGVRDQIQNQEKSKTLLTQKVLPDDVDFVLGLEDPQFTDDRMQCLVVHSKLTYTIKSCLTTRLPTICVQSYKILCKCLENWMDS